MSHTFILQVMNLTISQCLKHVKQPKMKAENFMLTSCFSGVRVARFLVFRVMFVDPYLSFCSFSFVHCIVCTSSNYGFWLPLWYLQTFRSANFIFKSRGGKQIQSFSNFMKWLKIHVQYYIWKTFVSSFDFNDLGIHDLLNFSLDCNIFVDIL